MNESAVQVRSEVQENEEVNMGDAQESEDVIVEHEEVNMGDAQENEDVIVGTIPCPTNEKVNEKQGEKPIV
jgi:hypothetical protein